MTALWIDHVNLVSPGESITPGRLLIEDGKIARLNPPAEACPADAVRIDGRGRLLTTGLIDIHTHGIATSRFDTGGEALIEGVKTLPAFGVTGVLPTLVPRFGPMMLEQLAAVSGVLPALDGAHVPGLHLEGPFLALPGAGCDTLPGDVGLLEEVLTACRERVIAMSISPDTANILPVIERLCERGIVPFITHTRATAEETQAAIHAGACHATHFYDAFYSPAETDPGVRPTGAVEAVLANAPVSVDFIADGVHVHPMAIRAALAAKGWRGIILITDANIGAGLPDGCYETPSGYAVNVRAGHGARISGDHPLRGALAGSALTMNVGIANLLSWLAIAPEQVWAMGSLNPARLLGLHNKGCLTVGADADLVLWDENLCAAQTWINGKSVFARDG